MKLRFITWSVCCILIYRGVSGTVVHGQTTPPCEVKALTAVDLPSTTGDLLYFSSLGMQSVRNNLVPNIEHAGSWKISPDGRMILTVYSPDINTNVRLVAVFDQRAQLIYAGASVGGGGTTNWFGNDRILRLNYTLTGRDPRLRSYFHLSYYIIDPFARTYVTFDPPTDEWEDSFFYEGDRPIELYFWGNMLTFDGRYLLSAGEAFDFVSQQVIPLENARVGVPSMTSHRFLVVEYNSFDYMGPTEEQVHPIQVYDLDTDTLQQIATITTDRLMDVYENSWSPDETQWAYSLDFGDTMVFRPINILDLSTGESSPTCLGQYYQSEPTVIENTYYSRGDLSPDFAWSRDSRYLALQGVLEGEDMDESLGVYIYDTQTGDIYQVQQGRAGIVGWMASPNTE